MYEYDKGKVYLILFEKSVFLKDGAPMATSLSLNFHTVNGDGTRLYTNKRLVNGWMQVSIALVSDQVEACFVPPRHPIVGPWHGDQWPTILLHASPWPKEHMEERM